MMDAKKNYDQLKRFCLNAGAGVYGVADVTGIKEEFLLNKQCLRGINRAICLGVRLSNGIISEIENAPTKLYFHHYKTANMFLDQLAFKVASFIQAKGFTSIAIPASQILDWQQQKAHLSHKHLACLAGLGWIGRNNLLVTKKFGAQIRLVTILTAMPLRVDKPLTATCAGCRACVLVCPAGAIKEEAKDFDHLRCFEKLKEFQKQRLVDQYICGVCVAACKGAKK